MESVFHTGETFGPFRAGSDRFGCQKAKAKAFRCLMDLDASNGCSAGPLEIWTFCFFWGFFSKTVCFEMVCF